MKQTEPNKLEWIEKLKDIAESNYNKSYGYQVFVECCDDEEWTEFVGGIASYKDAENMLHRIAAIHTDRYESAVAEIF